MLDRIALVVYGGLGAALFGSFVYEVGAAAFSSGSAVATVAFVVLVLLALAALAMDVRRRRFGLGSRVVLGIWVVCVALVVASLTGCGSHEAASDGRGTYWCVVGTTTSPWVGACTMSEMSCQSKRRSAEPADAQLRCARTTTLLYEVEFEGQYGPMEAWYVDRATCERVARTFWRTDAPCEAAPWETTGQRAH